MPRRLDMVHRLLRDPCPVDPSAFPRTAGGFDCAKCGRVVVDVAGLTLEEAVEFRRRSRGGGERVCGAYTVDREARVLVRASTNSSALVAVAVSALLAACEAHAPGGTSSAVRASPEALVQQAEVRETAPAPAASVAQAPVPAVEAPAPKPSAGPEHAAATNEGPPCTTKNAAIVKRSGRDHSRRDKDLQLLAGY